MKQMKLCFASRNPHKIEEIQAILGNRFEIVSLNDIACEEELAETGDTIPANSLQKARYVWDTYQVNCFADDSGLEVAAIGGEPGVHSAYYSGSRDFEANIALLLAKLRNAENRAARFITVITLILEGEVRQFEGIVEGEILHEKRGMGGFGYDPLFLPKGYDLTFAEMSSEAKNGISSRSRAFQKMLYFLQEIKN